MSDTKKPRIQMADLARMAGVSKATVSRALADSPLINAETRQRIQQLAREHQYAVNLGARNLRLQRNQTIAVVVPYNSSKYKFRDGVYAVYGTYSDHLSKLLYQVGLRFESSDYLGTIINQNSTFHIQYPFSFFPSAYLTYKLPKNQDLQLNYSRKINRPNFFQLMPFADFSDPQNINIGNAGLTPEFIHTLDLDYQKLTEKSSSILASVYYKHIDNLISRYQYRDIGANGIDSVIYNSYQNSSFSQSYGLELTLRTSPVKWWEITSNLNFYNAQINGSNLATNLKTERLSWFAKMNWNFTLPKNVSIQLSGDYQSKTVLPVLP